MNINQFRELGIYEEKPERVNCNLSNGKAVSLSGLSSEIQYSLANPRGHAFNGDPSRQDFSVIRSLLKSGLSPADVYATFILSPRGQDAVLRKNGHLNDYITRTIEKAQGDILDRNIHVNFSNFKTQNNESGLVTQKLSEIEIRRTNWIWRNYIPAGKLTLIAGEPGIGKSTIVGDVIAKITRGAVLPTGERSGVTARCIIASAEDSTDDTIGPRLISAGVDQSRVEFIKNIFTLPNDINLLKDRIVKFGARILVIDPLNAYIAGGVDSHNDHDVRRILSPLDELARETECAIILISHFNKSSDRPMAHRVSGTVAYVAAARSVLIVSRLNDDQKVLSCVKCNLSRRPPSLAYRIIEKTLTKNGLVTWTGDLDVIKSTKIQWIGEVDFDPNAPTQGAVPESNIMQQATDFLQQLLHDGEIISDQVYAEAKNSGLSKAQVNRAKAFMKIRSVRRDSRWYWNLP
jgi:hypothetical protein